METINGCVVIASVPVSTYRRIILAVRFDSGPDEITYITAAANQGPVASWDHGRYHTAQTVYQQASALEMATDDLRERVTNSQEG